MLTTKAWLEGIQERKGQALEKPSKDHSFKDFGCDGKATKQVKSVFVRWEEKNPACWWEYSNEGGK